MSDAASKLLEQIRALPEEDQRFVCDRLWEPYPLGDDPLGDLPDSEDYPGPSIYIPPEEWERAFFKRREPGTEPPLPTPPPSALALELWDRVAAAPPDDQQFIADEIYQFLGYGYDPSDDNPEWRAESDRRIEAVGNGTAELIPGEAVMDELRARFAARNAARGGGD